MKKSRLANLELLRMIAMMMVVTIHISNHGGLVDLAQKGTFSYYVVWTLFGLSFVAINVYILISGYFLVESSFSSWRLIKMEMQIWFYSMVILSLFWIFGDVEHDLKYLVYCLTPVVSDFYWFATMYVGMYLLSPILNTFVRSISKRQFQCVLLLLFVLLSAWTNIFYYTSGMNIVEGVSIAWFVAVYLFGAYIRMYYIPDGKAGKWFLIGGGLTVLIPVSRFIIDALLSTQWLGTRMLEDLLWGYSISYHYNSMFSILGAAGLFVAFLNLKLKDGIVSKFINLAASASFAVYLIHDHYYMRENMWDKINPWAWLDDWYLLPAIIITVIGIYVVCMIIEWIRHFVFRPVEKWIKPYCDKFDAKLREIWHGKKESDMTN